MPIKHFDEIELRGLKREAKALKRAQGITHSKALDCVAKDRGYPNWSLLMKHSAPTAAQSAAEVVDAVDVETLIEWFAGRHERAVEVSPFESAEGGYLWPTIDDSDLSTYLAEEFPEAEEHVLEAASLRLSLEGPWMDPKFMDRLNE